MLDGFSAAVLAGGRGRRLGRAKADLPWGDDTLLGHTVTSLGRLFPEVMAVGAEVDGARAVPDPDPPRGPLGGIRVALAVARNPHVFVAGCDLPFLNPALIRGLCRLAADWQIVVPESEPDYLEPLHAVYHRSCLPLIDAWLESGGMRVSGFFGQARVRVVGPPELEQMGRRTEDFLNVNTPDDYRRALALRETPVVAVTGPSGSGKTTLLEILLAGLTRRGYRVGALKGTRREGLELDCPGKDTWRLRQAGAAAVGLAAPDASHVLAGLPPMGLRQLAARLAMATPVDLVLAEGFKKEEVPRVLVTGGESPAATPPGELLAVYGSGEGPAGVPRIEPGRENDLIDLLVGRFLS